MTTTIDSLNRVDRAAVNTDVTRLLVRQSKGFKIRARHFCAQSGRVTRHAVVGADADADAVCPEIFNPIFRVMN